MYGCADNVDLSKFVVAQYVVLLAIQRHTHHFLKWIHQPLPPSLHPTVILGIYSWPPSMHNLNYLFGEIGSLHDRILFVPFDSIKKTKCRPCHVAHSHKGRTVIQFCLLPMFFYGFIIIMIVLEMCMVQISDEQTLIFKVFKENCFGNQLIVFMALHK